MVIIPEEDGAPKAPPQYYISIDLETTGLKAEIHGICQIGAVAANAKGEIVSLFQSDVRPPERCLIDDSALKVNGFTRRRILDAPDESVVLPEFLRWLDPFSGRTPVAIFHNAPFDVGFIKVALNRHMIEEPRMLRRIRDTATMSPAVYGDVDYPRSLSEICKTLAIEQFGIHDGLHDALNTHKAFFALKAILERRRLQDVIAHSKTPTVKPYEGPITHPSRCC